MKKCAVIGSINMDLTIRVPHFPAPGETLTGSRFETVPGGKGANQAVALARLGIPVRMVGLVGGDAFGQRYLDYLRAEGADVSLVGVHPTAPTGVANILIDEGGENSIVVVPGANGECGAAWLDSVIDRTADCDVFLLQLELPLQTVEACVQRLHAMGKTVILDPAPAVPLSEQTLAAADYVTPNETELRILTAALPQDASADARIAALSSLCGGAVIHKRGADGAYIGTQSGVTHVPGFTVDVVDTTAAGDTFNAGFAAGMVMGLPLEEAVRMGNAAGALAVTAFGAQGGMPTMEQLRALLTR